MTRRYQWIARLLLLWLVCQSTLSLAQSLVALADAGLATISTPCHGDMMAEPELPAAHSHPDSNISAPLDCKSSTHCCVIGCAALLFDAAINGAVAQLRLVQPLMLPPAPLVRAPDNLLRPPIAAI